MSYAPFVTIVYRLNNLLKEELGFRFRHLSVSLGFQVRVKRTSLDMLYDQVHLLVRVECFIELNYISIAWLCWDDQVSP